MKKHLLLLVAFLIATSASAQFYVSASGGYSFPTSEKKLGTSTTVSGVTDLNGSYGEGLEVSLRGGYSFNEKWAFELGLGYLHGADQDVQSLNIPGASADLIARGRAFGASLSGVYSFSDKFYARVGFLTKVGGMTEAVTDLNIDIPAQLVNPSAPAGATAPLSANFTTEFNGKFPSGIVGAVGYKIPVGENLNLFAEVEYMGINVTRNVSNSSDFSANIAGNPIDKATLTSILGANPGLAPLVPLYSDSEIQWGEGPYPSSEAPYSSIGVNFGITYTFSKK